MKFAEERQRKEKETEKLIEENSRMHRKFEADLKKDTELIRHLEEVMSRIDDDEEDRFERQNEEMVRMRKDLTWENEELKKEMALKEKESKKHAHAVNGLKKENENYKAESIKVKEVNEDLQKQVSVINKHQEVLVKKFDFLEKNFRIVNDERQDLMEKVQKLEIENVYLQRSVTENRIKKSLLAEKNKSLELMVKQNDLLKERITEMNSRVKFHDCKIKDVLKQLL